MWVLLASTTVTQRCLSKNSKNQGKTKRTKMGEPDRTCCAEQICDPYHSIPTIGSSTGTPADDFVYAFLVDGCVALWQKHKKKNHLNHLNLQFHLFTGYLVKTTEYSYSRWNTDSMKPIPSILHKRKWKHPLTSAFIALLVESPEGRKREVIYRHTVFANHIKSLILLQKHKHGFQNKFTKSSVVYFISFRKCTPPKSPRNPVFNRSMTGVLVCVSDCWFLRSYFASSRSLFTRPELDWPDKFSAHRAESGLPEEGSDELVVLYEVDLGLLDGPSSTVQGGSLFLLHRMFALFQAEGKTEFVKQRCCRESKVGFVLITN